MTLRKYHSKTTRHSFVDLQSTTGRLHANAMSRRYTGYDDDCDTNTKQQTDIGDNDDGDADYADEQTDVLMPHFVQMLSAPRHQVVVEQTRTTSFTSEWSLPPVPHTTREQNKCWLLLHENNTGDGNNSNINKMLLNRNKPNMNCRQP